LSLESLEITPLCSVIAPIIAERDSGRMTVVSRDRRTELWWAQGDLVLASTTAPALSLGAFLERGGHIAPGAGARLQGIDGADLALRFFDASMVSSDRAGPLLREWIESVVLPLFSLEEGHCAWESGEAIDPERRVFLPSMAALVLAGIRGITSGLALKRSIGDLSRHVEFAREPRFTLDAVPLNDDERRIAETLAEPTAISDYLKRAGRESVLAVRVAVELLTLGVWEIERHDQKHEDKQEMERSERDLSIMSTLGTSDERSLRAFAFARHPERSDH